MSDLTDAATNLSNAATRANKTTDFFDDVTTLGPTSTVKNPNNNKTVPSVQKQVKDLFDSLPADDSVDALEAAAIAVGAKYEEVIATTNTTTVLDDVLYIYDASEQVTWGVPGGVGVGEVIVSVDSGVLTTDVGAYTLNLVVNGRVNKTNAEILAGTPAIGELVMNTDENTLVLGDGFTVGGHKIPNRTANDNRYTAIFKNDAHGTAVENMIAGKINGVVNITHTVGNVYSTGGTSWVITDDVGIIISNGLYALPLNHVNIKDFGAVGDGVNDDGPSIRQCIKTVFSIPNGNCTVYSPRASSYYSIRTPDPDNTDNAITLDIETGSIYDSGFALVGERHGSKWVLETSTVIENLLAVKGKLPALSISRMYIDSNEKANNTFSAIDIANPYMSVADSNFTYAIDTNVKVDTFVSSFKNVLTLRGRVGFDMRNYGPGPNTSLNLTGCYANKASEIGFDMGYLTYSTFLNCAVDDVPLAYRINVAYGVAMTGCGAERCDKLLEVLTARGFSINTIFGLSCGSADELNPTPYLIEFSGGSRNVTINGVSLENLRNVSYTMGLTGVLLGSENITITDDSLNRGIVYINRDSYLHGAQAVKFLWDQWDRDVTIDVATKQELLDALANFNYKRINGDVVINLTADIIDYSSRTDFYEITKGLKNLVITSDTGTRKLSLVRLFRCDIIFKAVDIVSSGGAYSHAVNLIDSNVVLSDTRVTSIGISGAAVISSGVCSVVFSDGAKVVGSLFSHGGTYDVFSDGGLTTYNICQQTLETNLRLPIGVPVGLTGTTDAGVVVKSNVGYSVGSADWKLF